MQIPNRVDAMRKPAKGRCSAQVLWLEVALQKFNNVDDCEAF